MLNLIEIIKAEWPKVKEAPWSFASIICGVSFVCWQAMGWYYEARLKNLESELKQSESRLPGLEDRLKFKDDQLAEYRLKLNGASPEDARLRIDKLELQLKSLTQPRLSSEQERILSKSLEGTRGMIVVQLDMRSDHAAPFAHGLATAFGMAGWRTSRMNDFLPAYPSDQMIMRVVDKDNLTPTETAARKALELAGLPIVLKSGQPIPPRYGEGEMPMPELWGDVTLMIASKRER